LVFGSSVSKMSSRWQAVAAMLYATREKQRPLGAPVRALLSSLRGCVACYCAMSRLCA
jgi:hypothetical protein